MNDKEGAGGREGPWCLGRGGELESFILPPPPRRTSLPSPLPRPQFPVPGLAPRHARSLGLWPPNHYPPPFLSFPVWGWVPPPTAARGLAAFLAATPPRTAGPRDPPRPASGRPSLPARPRGGLAGRRRRRRPPSHGRPGEARGRPRGGGSDSRGRSGRAADAVSAMGRAGRAPPGLRGSLPSTSSPSHSPEPSPPLCLGDTPQTPVGVGGLLFPCVSLGKSHFRPAGCLLGRRAHAGGGSKDPGALESQVPNRLGSWEHLLPLGPGGRCVVSPGFCPHAGFLSPGWALTPQPGLDPHLDCQPPSWVHRVWVYLRLHTQINRGWRGLKPGLPEPVCPRREPGSRWSEPIWVQTPLLHMPVDPVGPRFPLNPGV